MFSVPLITHRDTFKSLLDPSCTQPQEVGQACGFRQRPLPDLSTRNSVSPNGSRQQRSTIAPLGPQPLWEGSTICHENRHPLTKKQKLRCHPHSLGKREPEQGFELGQVTLSLEAVLLGRKAPMSLSLRTGRVRKE